MRRYQRADRGIGIFVDELQQCAAMVSDRRVAVIAERLAAPLRVAITGCRGVGRRTVSQVLAREGVAVVGSVAAELVVRVLADSVKPEDTTAIEAANRPVLLVLNKADLIATSEVGRYRGGPTAAAAARCALLAGRAGLPVEPMVAVLAGAPPDDARWQSLQVLAAGTGHPVDDALDRFGTREAVAAIRRGATRPEVAAHLRGLSNVAGVLDRIDALGASPRYNRLADAVTELETLAAAVPAIAEFLAGDDAVLARMAAALDAAEALGARVDRTDTAEAHLRRARQWRRGGAGLPGTCGRDIVRGSLRLWVRAGGSA